LKVPSWKLGTENPQSSFFSKAKVNKEDESVVNRTAVSGRKHSWTPNLVIDDKRKYETIQKELMQEGVPKGWKIFYNIRAF
jgi:hypothetical protein